ncbi:MAG: hypothetical protein FWD38_06200 [Oscillospiraceae bacterium]|nr:hypothetical protein [Oscillospiraceae bacterium]
MSKIFVNRSGVQSQGAAIASSTSAAEQSSASYISQTTAHQGCLDGASRAGAIQFGDHARNAANAACATARNLSAFLENALQTVSSVDETQNKRFSRILRFDR